jgi:hypothetical protein
LALQIKGTSHLPGPANSGSTEIGIDLAFWPL